MTFIATSFLRTTRLKPSKFLSSCQTSNLFIPTKSSIPCRTFHATQLSKFRPTLRSNVRNYYSSNPNYGRKPSFFENVNVYLSYNNSALVYGIIAVNVGVWVGAWYAEAARSEGRPGPLIWILNNLASSRNNLMNGKVWTLVTSAFTHLDINHLFMNCLGIWMFCPAAAQMVGNLAFLRVYMLGSIGCDLFSIIWNSTSRGSRSSVGASGSLCAIMSFVACLQPRLTVRLYGIIPLPLWGVVAGIFLMDLYGANRGGMAKTDFAGHIGGTATGIGLYFIRNRLGLRGFY